MDIQYRLEPELSADEFIGVLRRSTLAERRPVDDVERMKGMLEHADVIATARTRDGLLVGVARAVSDYNYCTYLSDLAVDVAWQSRGIGRQLILQTRAAGGFHTSLILIAAPKSRDYYPRIGMQRHDSCWIVRGDGPASSQDR